MVSLNYKSKEISCKIVYYGPGLGGKTTNLQVIHQRIPQTNRSDMISLSTESDRTLFFDFLPLDLGKIKGYSTKFQLYTVPGQVYYNETRKLVLRGVDGIVFVADAQKEKLQETIESYANLKSNLKDYNLDLESIPIVLQFNKQDLPDIVPDQILNEKINEYNSPFLHAVAVKGQGVFETLKSIGKLVIDRYNQRSSLGGTDGGKFKKKSERVSTNAPESRAAAAPPPPEKPPKPEIKVPNASPGIDPEIQKYIQKKKQTLQNNSAAPSIPVSPEKPKTPPEKIPKFETDYSIDPPDFQDNPVDNFDPSDTNLVANNPFLDSDESSSAADSYSLSESEGQNKEKKEEENSPFLEIEPYSGIDDSEPKQFDDLDDEPPELDFDPYKTN